MAKLVGGWERDGESVRVFAVIPPLRNGEVNAGALSAALLALTRVNPDAFDPQDVPAQVQASRDGHTADGGGIIPHAVAEAAMRAGLNIDPEREDDTGDIYPDPRYGGVSCNVGGRCDD